LLPFRLDSGGMAGLTIYTVPRCSTCRRLHELLDERGVEYATIAYHDAGLTEDEIRGLLAKADAGPRDFLRTREPLVAELGLLDGAGVSDDELIARMAEHPRLMQRPVVVRGDRALLARPIERALELLD
jgi:arsenate reductase (glutaredoxin)